MSLKEGLNLSGRPFVGDEDVHPPFADSPLMFNGNVARSGIWNGVPHELLSQPEFKAMQMSMVSRFKTLSAFLSVPLCIPCMFTSFSLPKNGYPPFHVAIASDRTRSLQVPFCFCFQVRHRAMLGGRATFPTGHLLQVSGRMEFAELEGDRVSVKSRLVGSLGVSPTFCDTYGTPLFLAG